MTRNEQCATGPTTRDGGKISKRCKDGSGVRKQWLCTLNACPQNRNKLQFLKNFRDGTRRRVYNAGKLGSVRGRARMPDPAGKYVLTKGKT